MKPWKVLASESRGPDAVLLEQVCRGGGNSSPPPEKAPAHKGLLLSVLQIMKLREQSELTVVVTSHSLETDTTYLIDLSCTLNQNRGICLTHQTNEEKNICGSRLNCGSPRRSLSLVVYLQTFHYPTR